MERIFNTEEKAIQAAKEMALNEAGESFDENKKYEFLVRPKTSYCECGQTRGFNVVYFQSNEHQYEGESTLCENCGK